MPPVVQVDVEEPELDSASMHVASHVDGRALVYHVDNGTFDLGGVRIKPDAVFALDKRQELQWITYGVRVTLWKAVKKGVPMSSLRLASDRSWLERTSDVLSSVSDSLDPASPQLVCPHCQSRGTVRTKRVRQKKGISGGKATAAVLTGGVSLLATGLSRKETQTEAHCSNCGSTWRF